MTVELEDREKFITGKKIIFYSWGILVATLIILHIIKSKTYLLKFYSKYNLHYGIDFILVVVTVLMLIGLWKGSRGVDAPLTIRRSLNLLFGYPSSILFLFFMVLYLGL